MEPIEHFVFVYGTLTDPNRARAVVSPGAESSAAGRSDGVDGEPRPTGTRLPFVGEATIDGLHRVEGRYPTLAPGGSVGGRLLAVDDDGLGRLDRYEGVENGLYVRVTVPVADAAGSIDGDSTVDADNSTDAGTPLQLARTSEESPRVWTYVGDPDRLAPNEPITWPGDGPFERRVRRYVDDGPVAVEVSDDLGGDIGE